jgi:bis(5'-nucleosyl)-tetraphosphatase (symmetrical)
MALYLIGDVQGCDEPLQRLLEAIDFSPSRDTIYLLGDLVNRGPDSAGVLRRLRGYGSSAKCLLGNHDLNLLAVAGGVRAAGKRDTLDSVLQAPDCHDLLNWLRQQPLARYEHGILMVHAGVLPQWSLQQTLALACEVQAIVSGDSSEMFLTRMYGNEPSVWSDQLEGTERLRLIVNALTRLRFLTPDAAVDLKTSTSLHEAPAGLHPWFDMPHRQTASTTIAFGHWSQLGLLLRPNLLSLDTGCVWGGQLSALRLGSTRATDALIQVACQAFSPVAAQRTPSRTPSRTP